MRDAIRDICANWSLMYSYPLYNTLVEIDDLAYSINGVNLDPSKMKS